MNANYQIIQGDCIEVMKTLEADSFDSIVTDPPYGWRFMGKAWDGADIEKRVADRRRYHQDEDPRAGVNGGHNSIAAEAGKYNQSLSGNQSFQIWTEEWAREAFRVLKPGGLMLVFCGPRTYHRMATGVEDAGFEVRDQLMWIFGSGFPKSLNIGNGLGTALKPAHEPIVMARKPLEKGLSVAQNVRKWGTGAINVDGCRISADEPLTGGATGKRTSLLNMGGQNARPNHSRAGEPSSDRRYTTTGSVNFAATPGPRGGDVKGRFPANVIHDGSEEVVSGFPEQTSGANPTRRSAAKFKNAYGEFNGQEDCEPARGADSGSAARFFYCAKTDKADRHNGQIENDHPTVKPTDLMQYLCRLVTPAGGLILDPFLGSGSTAKAALIERFNVVGIEVDPHYVEIAKARLTQLQVKLF